MKPLRLLLLLLPLLVACDQLKERAGFVDPARQESEGKAIGAACRQAGRGLEACYQDNADALKGAVFDGWKEMNEYMLKNNMQEQPLTGKDKSSDKPSEKTAEKSAEKTTDKSSRDKAGETGADKSARKKKEQ